MSETTQPTGVLKYAQLISKKLADTVEEAKQVFTVKKEQKHLEMKIIELESEISSHDSNVADLKTQSPMNWEALCEAIDDKELAERKLAIYKALQKELF